jgi:hypothetical protein
MSHFAKIINGSVIQVIVAEQDFIDIISKNEPEEVSWVQTSYNVRNGVYYDPSTGLPAANQESVMLGYPERQRKNYATIGGTYDSELDIFINRKEYSKWVLNTNTGDWQPPIPAPDDGEYYAWNDADGEWEQLTERASGK